MQTSVERHDCYRYQDVREGQRDDEVVGDYPQLPVPHDTHDNQEVSEDRAYDDHPHYAGLEDEQHHVRPFRFVFAESHVQGYRRVHRGEVLRSDRRRQDVRRVLQALSDVSHRAHYLLNYLVESGFSL